MYFPSNHFTPFYRPAMLPKLRSELIMDAPKLFKERFGVPMPCTPRIASFVPVPCAPDETCVMHHHKMKMGKGMSTKVTDFGATMCTCSRCHDMLEGSAFGHTIDQYPTAVALRVTEAIIETMTMLAMLEIVTVKDGDWIK